MRNVKKQPAVDVKLAVTAAILAMAAPAVSQAELPNLSHMTLGYSYYNRPGATAADHDSAVVACSTEALKVRSFDSQVKFMTGILPELLADASNRGAFGASLENCMVVRGWRVVHLPDAEGEALSKLEPAALASHLAPWVGADQPHGDVVRVWGNDAANAAVTRYAIRPDHTNNGLLSLKAATASPLAKITLPEPAKIKPPKLDPKWPTRGLKPDQIASAIPETGVIIVDLKGLSGKNGIGISLMRMGADKDTFPSTVDHAPDALNLMVGTLAAKKEGNFLAFAVPPGHWRISSMGAAPILGFCLGSPSFEIKAGEVVYAGAFDLGAADLGPDLSLDVVKTWLAGQPAAAVRPAVYTNGARGLCGYNGLYALEVKGAPYEPGYQWGGAAVAAGAGATQ